jgi:hypothetical protein
MVNPSESAPQAHITCGKNRLAISADIAEDAVARQHSLHEEHGLIGRMQAHHSPVGFCISRPLIPSIGLVEDNLAQIATSCKGCVSISQILHK